jgi:hypothetical protein
MEGAISVNWWAIIVAAVVKFLLGWAWYAPPVLGREWQRLIGLNQQQMQSGLARAIPIDIVASLVMAYVLARFIGHYGAVTLLDGAIVGFMAWLGFAATITIGSFAYEQRPLKLFLINAGYLLIAMVVMGAIIAVWQDAPGAVTAPPA